MEKDQISCRVCYCASPLFFKSDRPFHKCPECSLIFTEQVAGVNECEEHYKKQWETQDEKFWNWQAEQLVTLMNRYKKSNSRVLDFGSGSGHLSSALEKKGVEVTRLEPMLNGFLKDQSYPNKFDVVIAIEVFEHLTNLREELDEINKVVKDDGIIIVTTLMTNTFIDTPDAADSFAQWWYKDDPTHVSFFCVNTLKKIAKELNWFIDVITNKLFIISKSE